MITFQTDGVEMPRINEQQIRNWVKAVAATYQKKVGEIGYLFCSDERILEVNRQFLQHDYYTDIITFDYCQGNRIAGDLVISLDTVRTNAEQFGAEYETELSQSHHPWNSASLRYQRQRSGRTRNHGSRRKQSTGSTGRHEHEVKCV